MSLSIRALFIGLIVGISSLTLGLTFTFDPLAVSGLLVLAAVVGLTIWQWWSNHEVILPRHSEDIHDLEVPSLDPEVRFLVSARLHWQTTNGDDPHRYSDQAHDALRTTAARILAHHAPEDLATAEIELTDRIGWQEPSQHYPIQTRATDIRVVVPEAETEFLKQRLEARKKVALWRERHAIEREFRDYLLTEVLTSPANVLAWWLARHPDDLKQAVELRGVFALLTAAIRSEDTTGYFARFANNAETVGRSDDPSEDGSVTRWAHRLTQEVHQGWGLDPERSLFADQLGTLLRAHGANDAAEALTELVQTS